jgi:hypothetical protein
LAQASDPLLDEAGAQVRIDETACRPVGGVANLPIINAKFACQA